MTLRSSNLDLIAVTITALLMSCADRQDIGHEYSDAPRLVSVFRTEGSSEELQPVRLQLVGDTLYVSYSNIPRLDLYDLTPSFVRSIDLTDPEQVFPTSFYVTDSAIAVCDHSKGAVVLYDRSGELVMSYGTLPDMSTRLAPFSLTYYAGTFYVGDIALQRVLAISAKDTPGITERGELILSIPADTLTTLGLPSSLLVTPDGRLLIGDASSAEILAFTCDGRFVYRFDDVRNRIAPQAFAIDNITDPSMQDTTTFDPSGIDRMGRIHVVDANNGVVHMFNPVGNYIASYPDTTLLVKPSSIAIDRKRNRIYIADPPAKSIYVMRYEG
jgi:sugar lactone lactonase YvrE